MYYSSNLLFFFGFMLDPLVYVFMPKHYRDIIVTTCFTCRRDVSAERTNVNIGLEHLNNAKTRPHAAEVKNEI